ncbi:MAG: hypothetical protein MUC79_13440 [Thiobacillaceae bacterium]|jgi:hypothetical protein|nr:hypothetical protein [Thiobacillaceae bacterium]
MVTRVDHYRMQDGRTPLAEDYFNPIWSDLDRRLDILERLRVSWLDAVTLLQSQGLARLNEGVAPLLQQLQDNAAEVIASLESLGEVATAEQGALADSALQPADIGVSVQASHANLAALAGLSGQANRVAYFSAAGAMALTALTASARTLLAASDATAQRAALGLEIGNHVQAYSAALDAWAALAPPTGEVVGTSGSQTLAGKTVTGLQETRTAPSISAGTLTLDCAAGNVFTVALNANITTLNFSNVPVSGTAYGCTVEFTADGTQRTITWGSSVKWPGGWAPTPTATNGKVDRVVLTTHNGGTTWYAANAGQNY